MPARPVMSALLLTFAPALAGCGRGHAEDAGPDVPPLVRTVEVGPADGGGATYTGSVRARIESDLGFRVGGKIAERLVDPGRRVRRGQALMRLDPADLALAAVGAAERLRAAQADAARAAADEARLQGLVEAGAVSAAAYDAALAGKRATAANLAAARAAAAAAANQRAYATLSADSDGVVTDVLAQPGQVVAAGAPVVRLGRAGAREALVAVPETAVAALPRVGTARLYGGDAEAIATLREVAGSADPLTRTFAARYALSGPAAAAPLGSTVTVRLASSSAAVQVPLAALHDPGSGPGVWVVRADSRVAFRRVGVVALGAERASLAPGALRPGERVVALGAQLLREGQAVRVQAPAAEARP